MDQNTPKTYRPTRWATPPECAGQIVEISYALDPDAEVVIVRRHDRSDRSTTYWAYGYPDAAECHGGWWDPHNTRPDLGDDLGECLIAYTERID